MSAMPMAATETERKEEELMEELMEELGFTLDSSIARSSTVSRRTPIHSTPRRSFAKCARCHVA